MPRLRACLLLAAAASLAACGDDHTPALPDAAGDVDADLPPPDADTRDILDRLRDLPGVVSVTEQATDQPGYRLFDLRMTQLVDHADPDGQTFTQQMTLLHRDEAAPLVLVSTGYWNYFGDARDELTAMLSANQLVVEHRYFGESRPEPADWTQLTIENAATDHHVVTERLGTIYRAPWLATGASKGGMTSVYHRRFFPDDVAGAVPYVAPISFGAPDYRYDAFVDAIGPAGCRQALRDLTVELLTDRRAYLEARATTQAQQGGWTYDRISLPAAVESAIVSLEWAFWQYVGEAACDDVPAVTASDASMWSFLDIVSSVTSSSDVYAGAFEAYYYQAAFELGYPGTMDPHLEGLLQHGPEAYDGMYPVGVAAPTYVPGAMVDVDAWVQDEGDRLLFVYGELDPWTGGRFALGDAADSLSLTAPGRDHGAGIADLQPADRTAALARLEAWSGVTPVLASARARRAPAPPRVPPAVLHGLRLRAAAAARR
jgi:hypothetical protein